MWRLRGLEPDYDGLETSIIHMSYVMAVREYCQSPRKYKAKPQKKTYNVHRAVVVSGMTAALG